MVFDYLNVGYYLNVGQRDLKEKMKMLVFSESPCVECGASMVLQAKKSQGVIINWWSCVEFGMQKKHVVFCGEKVGA